MKVLTVLNLFSILVSAKVFAKTEFESDESYFLTNQNPKGKFFNVLRGLRQIGDQQLLSIFPSMKTTLTSFHNYVDQCYDQTVEHNETVNIFKHKVKQIVKIYFVSYTIKNICHKIFLKLALFFNLEKSISFDETFQP